jgi:hypothetical protein
LSKNPDIVRKLQAGVALSAGDLAQVRSALSDATKNGAFKVGYQFIQGFLVYIPPPQ